MEEDIRQKVKEKIQSGDFDCAKELTLSMFQGKHKLFILWELRKGNPIHFNEFTRLIPNVSRKVLTNQLNELIQDNMIQKNDYDEGNVKRVSYELTQTGKTIMPILEAMYRWGENRIEELKISPNYQTNSSEN
ncbi:MULTISPECIES: winged helix-turn-helix transcriptional regulator [Holzapfeliella]